MASIMNNINALRNIVLAAGITSKAVEASLANINRLMKPNYTIVVKSQRHRRSCIEIALILIIYDYQLSVYSRKVSLFLAFMRIA